MKIQHLSFFLIILFSAASCEKDKKTVGPQIEGDFNGDGKIEVATLKYVSAEKLDNVIMFEYSVSFTDSSIKPIVLKNTFRKLQLINEGDLNEDNADDISISYELHPEEPISRMETRSLGNKKWNYLIQDITIHPGFDTLSSKDLQNVITKNGKSIKYYTYGNSFQFDKNYKPINSKKIAEEIKLK